MKNIVLSPSTEKVTRKSYAIKRMNLAAERLLGAESAAEEIQADHTLLENTMLSKPSRFYCAALSVLIFAMALASAGAHAAAPIDLPLAGFTDKYAQVNGVRIHYKVGGKGTPVVLLHGYAETGHMWVPAMRELVRNHTVIVPDLRGAGSSGKPEKGYDKKTMAVDIHELVQTVSQEPAAVVGHDIGLMVAYGYAAQFPADTRKLVGGHVAR